MGSGTSKLIPSSQSPADHVHPNTTEAPGASTEDYEKRLMLLEQQNKNRVVVTREEQGSFSRPPEQESLNAANDNDPTQTGYDPEAPWTNIYNILTGRMTPIGQHYFREDKYVQNETRDCKNCDEWRDWCFKYSPTVIFLKKNIEALNGDLNAKNVRCRRCPTRRTEEGSFVRQGGGFSPDHGILICANEMRDRKHLEDTLAHEMVHAWDHLRWKVDWADLRHAACTEVCSLPIGMSRCANGAIDPGFESEWRVSIHERILDEKSLEAYTATSELCTNEGGEVCDG
jgi:mitochondrial inner membrane protease ATP23